MTCARKITILIAMAVLALCSLKASAAEYASREEAVALVRRTIALIKRDGIDAIVKAVNDKDQRFRDRDLYVFIHDLRVPGKLIAHGTNIKLTQENNINYQDQNGKYFVREQIEIGKTKGSGWVDYRIANADKTAIADKSAYVERIGDYMVGVGVYKRKRQMKTPWASYRAIFIPLRPIYRSPMIWRRFSMMAVICVSWPSSARAGCRISAM